MVIDWMKSFLISHTTYLHIHTSLQHILFNSSHYTHTSPPTHIPPAHPPHPLTHPPTLPTLPTHPSKPTHLPHAGNGYPTMVTDSSCSVA